MAVTTKRGHNAVKGKQGFQSIKAGRNAPSADPRSAQNGRVEETEARPQTTVKETKVGPMLTFAADIAAKGTDAPPRVVQTSAGRFYVPNPSDDEYAAQHPLKALVEGKAFPSVTTCIGVLEKKAVLPWSLRCAGEKGVEYMKYMHRALKSGDEARIDRALARYTELLQPVSDTDKRPVAQKEISTAHEKQRDAAASRGTDAHAHLEDVVRHGEHTFPVPKDLQGYVDGFNRWREAYPDMKFVATEMTVMNPEARYAGTLDAIVEITDPETGKTRRYVVDYKTNKKGVVYDTVGMQLAAGAHASHVLLPDGKTRRMMKIDGGIGLALTPDGTYNARPFTNTAPYFEGFKGTVDVWYAQALTKVHWKNVPQANTQEDLFGYYRKR